MKLTKYILTLLIINYTLLITNCFSQQWRVFTTSNSPLPSNSIGTMVIDTNNVKWIGTNNGLVIIDGNNWTIYDTTNSAMPVNSCSVGAVDLLHNIWIRPANNGLAEFDRTNWILYNSTNSGLPFNGTSCVTIDNDNSKWIGCGGLTKFNDINWTIYNTTNSGLPSNVVTTVAIEGHIKWIGTFALSGGMARFNDTNWVIYNTSNSGIPSNIIRNIRIDVFGNKWICTYGGGLAKFNSMENSWTIYDPSNSGLSSYQVYCIAFKNNYIKYIGLETNGISIFNDTTWQNFNTSNSPLPNNAISDIKIDKYNNIWITTLGGLAIYNPHNIIGINTEFENLPRKYILYQNFPNPFNPTTKIKYQIPNNSFVSMKIFDIAGKELSSLINQKQNAGIYEASYNASDLPSGIYFYSLYINGSIIDTKKLILIK